MYKPRTLILTRVILIVTIFLNSLALYEFAALLVKLGLWFTSLNWKAATGLEALALVLEVFLLAITWTKWRESISQVLNTAFQTLKRLRAFNLLFFIAFAGLYFLAIFGSYSQYLGGTASRFFLFWLVGLAGSLFLMAMSVLQNNGSQGSWIEYMGSSLVLLAFSYKVAAFLPNITNYPFTIEWSEASRYYFASLFFSKQIYGLTVPPSVLHPSRYLMQSVPFLIPNTPLWVHRAWQVFLWIGTTLLTSYLLVRRLSIHGQLKRWLLVIWCFLFVMVGPVYYHLQVPAIIILWGFKPDFLTGLGQGRRRTAMISFAKSLGVVILASIWAGISRINWFPVPGLLAATLYFLEKPVGCSHEPSSSPVQATGRPDSTQLSPWRYLLPPIIWVVLGTLTAFVAQAFYILWSGNQADQFTTSFTSNLLWYRLLPNSTFFLGILPAALLVSLPLFLLIAYRLIETTDKFPNWRLYHPIRFVSLAAILLVLFAGGLVVSIKIGGGNNLHNLDAYMIVLLVVAATIYFAKATPDHRSQETPLSADDTRRPKSNPRLGGNILAAGFALALVVPVYFMVAFDGPEPPLPSSDQAAKGLAILANYSQKASQNGGKILFLADRQLITFHYLEGIPLVPEYERVFLMEMAMAHDRAYLNQFIDDLKTHRFSLIVSEPLFRQRKGDSEIFGEENDAWVKEVTKNILCYYQPVRTVSDVHIQLLMPSPTAGNCR